MAVLGGNGDLAGVGIVVPPLVVRTVDSQGVVGGRGRPVEVDVLDCHLAGDLVPDGQLTVVGADGDEVVVEQKSLVGDVVGLVVAGLAAGGEEEGGKECQKQINVTHC